MTTNAFRTDDLPPLAELMAAIEKFNSHYLVDEPHSWLAEAKIWRNGEIFAVIVLDDDGDGPLVLKARDEDE